MHATILGIFLGALILSAGGIRIFSEKLWNLLIKYMQSPTSLWVLLATALLLLAYIYLTNKKSIPLSLLESKYRFIFHVYWDENYNMRCVNCGNFLKSSSDKFGDRHTFFCSIKKCSYKHVLRDKNGNLLTEQQAIDLIKNMQL